MKTKENILNQPCYQNILTFHEMTLCYQSFMSFEAVEEKYKKTTVVNSMICKLLLKI